MLFFAIYQLFFKYDILSSSSLWFLKKKWFQIFHKSIWNTYRVRHKKPGTFKRKLQWTSETYAIMPLIKKIYMIFINILCLTFFWSGHIQKKYDFFSKAILILNVRTFFCKISECINLKIFLWVVIWHILSTWQIKPNISYNWSHFGSEKSIATKAVALEVSSLRFLWNPFHFASFWGTPFINWRNIFFA